MILLAYILPSIILWGGVALYRSNSATAKGNYLNLISIVHSLWYLVLTVLVIVFADLPVFYLSNEYFFIDKLGIYEVLITSIVFLLSSVYARGYVRSLLDAGEIDPAVLKIFYGCFNSLLLVVTLALFSNSFALFWIFLELTTILSAVLIVTLNAKENIVAALKYVFIASTAMLFSIIGLIILFAMTKHIDGVGTLNWSVLMQEAQDFPPSLFAFAFMLIFVGFAAKAGIAPFHTWLPQAHAKAPSVVSTLLSAVLLNVGIYGILRLYAIANQASLPSPVQVMLVVFGVLTIAIAAFSMLPRTNIKKLIAFSSIEHMGLVLIGIGLGTPLVIFWVLFHTLAHALTKALLFFSAGILHRQYESNKTDAMSDVLALQPLASFGLIAGSVAIIGIPLFPVFLSKLFILTELTAYSVPVLAVVLLLLLIVAAAFAVMLIRLFSKTGESGMAEHFEAPWTMKLPIWALLAGILALGVYFPVNLQHMLDDIVISLGF